MYTLSIDLSKSKNNSKSDQQFRIHFVFISRWFVINKFEKLFLDCLLFITFFCIDFPPIPWWIVVQHNLLALWDLQEPMLIIIDLIWFETNVQNDSIMDVNWWVSLKPQFQMANRKKKVQCRWIFTDLIMMLKHLHDRKYAIGYLVCYKCVKAWIFKLSP